MARRRNRSDDLKNLVQEAELSCSSNPVIHVSNSRASGEMGKDAGDEEEEEGDAGISNPVFTLGDDEAEEEEDDEKRPASSPLEEITAHGAAFHKAGSQPELTQVEVVEKDSLSSTRVLQPIPPLHLSSSSPGLRRRGSHNLVTSNSLTVPGSLTPRRHSLSGSSGSSTNLLSPNYAVSDLSSSFTWSEVDALEKRRGSQGSLDSVEEMGRRMSTLSSSMSERLKDLRRRFSERTERYKERTAQPPTPSTGDSTETRSVMSAVSGASDTKKDAEEDKKADDLKEALADKPVVEEKPVRYWKNRCCSVRVPGWWDSMKALTSAIDPQSRVYLCWLALVSACYVYNAIASTLRAAFRAGPFYQTPEEIAAYRQNYVPPTVTDCTNYTQNGTVITSCFANASSYNEQDIFPPIRWKSGVETPENRIYWWIVDYTCDFIYIIDILFVRSRIAFINNGLFETNLKECWKNYRSKTAFKYDIMSLTPLDLLYFIPQLDYLSLVRLPRILRIHIFWEFFDRVDQVAKSGYIIRVIRTLTYMLYLIHVESCGYYLVSAYEGFGLNDWVYSGEGNAYIRCMYLATKTATSIGNNPRPYNTLEYGFMTVYWLSGVFVFAMLIGQIRDIFQSATSAETTYRRSMDRAVSYMQGLNVPKDLQDKVRSWFNYNWEHQKTLNENSLLSGLPIKMVADLQISVHFNTLSKVQLFQDCEKNLLYDLVVKLQPVLYLPKDYICKKGEVGTEMYIVKQGQVEVVGGENDSIVFATLHEGSVFGEISLLGIQGGNRRTASVRSKGYSNLFVLTKVDFEVAMSDYPEAHKLLKKRSKKVLAKNKKKVEEAKKVEVEEIIKPATETPKMLKTVISIMEPDSKLQNMLRRPSLRRGSYISELGSCTPTESLRGDLDLLSNQSDEEIIRIEREERPLTADEATKLIANGDLRKGDAEPAVVITMEPLKSSSSPTNDDSRLLTPECLSPPLEGSTSPPKEEIEPCPQTTSPVDLGDKPAANRPSVISNGRINKVYPAKIKIIQEDSPKTAEKKRKNKPKSASKLSRSNRIEPIGQDPQKEAGESQIERPASRSKTEPNLKGADDKKKRKKRKSAGDQDKIPTENLVTCDVEVHREESASPLPPTNPAPNGAVHKDTGDPEDGSNV